MAVYTPTEALAASTPTITYGLFFSDYDSPVLPSQPMKGRSVVKCTVIDNPTEKEFYVLLL
jgi:hypothetical protein